MIGSFKDKISRAAKNPKSMSGNFPSSFDLSKVHQLKKSATPQIDSLWRVELPNLVTHEGKDISASPTVRRAFENSRLFQGDMESINSRVASISVPNISYESEFNDYFHYNMLGQYGNISIDIEEWEDGKTRDYIECWDSIIGFDTHRHNPPYFYKRNIVVYELSTTKIDLTRTVYSGVVFNSVSELDLNYDGADILRYNISLTVDGVEREYLGNEELINRVEERLKDVDLTYDLELGFPPDTVSQRRIFDQLSSSLF